MIKIEHNVQADTSVVIKLTKNYPDVVNKSVTLVLDVSEIVELNTYLNNLLHNIETHGEG